MLTNWRKRWVEIENGILSYYEKYDEKDHKPINVKGKMNLKGAELVQDESFIETGQQTKKIYISGCKGENDLMLDAPVNL
jgi:hypothetical protein